MSSIFSPMSCAKTGRLVGFSVTEVRIWGRGENLHELGKIQ